MPYNRNYIQGKTTVSVEVTPENYDLLQEALKDFDPDTPPEDLKATIAEQAQRIQELEAQQENAAQAMAETHNSWEARCHAIMAALEQDFGGFSTDVPEVGSWYEVNSKRLKKEREDALIEASEARVKAQNAREEAITEAIPLVKEAISQIVYDSWYKTKYPVTSHAHQYVGEAAEAAMKSVLRGPK